MKQKLKYLLIIGTTLSIANGAMQDIGDVRDENAYPPGLAKLSTRIKNKTTLVERPGYLLNLKSDVVAKMTLQEALIADLEDQKSGFKQTIGAIPKAMSQNLMLKSKLASVEIQLQNAQIAYKLCAYYIKDIESGRVESDLNKINQIQQFVQPGLPKLNTTDTTSCRGKESARLLKSLIKQAQQNCLGKVTALLHNTSDGNSRVVMTPSTTRPPKSVLERSPVGWGNISPPSSDIDESNYPMDAGSFMLPPPILAVPSHSKIGHSTLQASPAASPNTPRPSRTGSGDSFGLPSPATGSPSTPLQWRDLGKIRV
jgi:hypothetical protein